MEKTCINCGKTLNVKYFYKVKINKDGRNNQCSFFVNEKIRKRYKEDSVFRNKKLKDSKKQRDKRNANI